MLAEHVVVHAITRHWRKQKPALPSRSIRSDFHLGRIGSFTHLGEELLCRGWCWHGAFRCAFSLPKLGVAGEELVEIALSPIGAGPAHFVVAKRWFALIGRIPIQRQPPGKIPSGAVRAFTEDVIIGIHHVHDDPFVRAACYWSLMLVL